MADRFWLGPWRWTNFMGGSFNPPDGSRSGLDLAKLSQMTTPGSDRSIGLFLAPDTVALPSEYFLLGSGDLREINSTSLIQDAFQSEVGVRPEGAKASDLIWDTFTRLSDPEGLTAPAPLMGARELKLHLGVRLRSELFSWSHPHMNRTRDVLRRNFRRTFLAGIDKAARLRTLSSILPNTWNQIRNSTDPRILEFRGLLLLAFRAGLTVTQAKTRLEIRAQRAETHARRILDYWRLKYRAPWQDLVPPDLLPDIPGPLPHETSLADNFNGTTNDDLLTGGTSQIAWHEETDANWVFHTNGVLRSLHPSVDNTSKLYAAWADTNLSSDDQEVSVLSLLIGTLYYGPVTRYSETGDRTTSSYYAIVLDTDSHYLIRLNGGVQTNIWSTSTDPVAGQTTGLTSDGSDHTIYQNGVAITLPAITDTSITGYTSVGITAYQVSTSAPVLDDFNASDLGAGGITAPVDAGVVTITGVEPTVSKVATVPTEPVTISATTLESSKSEPVSAQPITVTASTLSHFKSPAVPAVEIQVIAPALGEVLSAAVPAAEIQVTAAAVASSKSASLSPTEIVVTAGTADGLSASAINPGVVTVTATTLGSVKTESLASQPVTVTAVVINTLKTFSIDTGALTVTAPIASITKFIGVPTVNVAINSGLLDSFKAAVIVARPVTVGTSGFIEFAAIPREPLVINVPGPLVIDKPGSLEIELESGVP